MGNVRISLSAVTLDSTQQLAKIASGINQVYNESQSICIYI